MITHACRPTNWVSGNRADGKSIAMGQPAMSDKKLTEKMPGESLNRYAAGHDGLAYSPAFVGFCDRPGAATNGHRLVPAFPSISDFHC